MIHFENGIDNRARGPIVPTVARFTVKPGDVRFVVIGTAYGYIHTTGGDVRTWRSYSGARRFARQYALHGGF